MTLFSQPNPQCHDFLNGAHDALANDRLQKQLAKSLKDGFQKKRLKGMSRLPEYEQLRDRARDIKIHTLENLDLYLEQFETQVINAGGQVHWAKDDGEACQIILDICDGVKAKTVTKGKSMITEEIGLNAQLKAQGIVPIETDLGEYIIQLRDEPPSHIIAPAFHISKEQVADTFRQHHADQKRDRDLSEPTTLVHEARTELRAKFLSADVGITGANFLIAESGTGVIVTNEGNGDLTQSLPSVHIAVGSIEKIVPTLEDADTLLRLLARTATGQELSVYTTFFSGAKRTTDMDGPEQFHLVLLDNRRSDLLGGPLHDVLRCIRCGACINHCPIYGKVSGHAYGWVYPGPIGSILTPHFVGVDEAHLLPNACTMCGRCEEVCPVRIALPKLLRIWRGRAFEAGYPAGLQRLALKIWAALAKRAGLYRWMARLSVFGLRLLGPLRPYHLPKPQGGTFMDRYNGGEK